VAESYLHWFHGVNPMGKVMLTNMYAYGGDSCVNEFYHSWFGNGTIWDNVFTSPNGPAPGYLIGGPNKDFSIPAISPPGGQPPQKSYREWNTGWNGTANENSWEITEAGIYTQAAYISLLVRVMANGGATALPLHVLSVTASRNDRQALVSWQTDGRESKEYEVQRSKDGINFTTASTFRAETGKMNYSYTDIAAEALKGLVYYRIRETDLQDRVYYSSIVKLNGERDKNLFSVYPNPVKNFVTVNGYTSKADNIMLNFYDAGGRVVKQLQWQQPEGVYSKTVSVEELVKGVYWVEMKSGGEGKRVQIIKQ
jgi:hypothetical protein